MEKNSIFQEPLEPYFFKNSKRFNGMFLESFIFDNSKVFYELEARIVREEGDSLSRHIQYLVEASCGLESHILCPFCKTEPIKYLLFLDCSILDLKLSSCSELNCREALKQGRSTSRLIPLNLRGLRQFRTEKARKRAELIFRKAFKVGKKTSPIKVFQLFQEADKRRKETTASVTANTEKKAPLMRTRHYFGRRPDAVQKKIF